MKTLVVLGTLATTLVAATIVTDNRSEPEFIQLDPIEVQAEAPMEMTIESDGLIYEYPSVEDASIITDMPEDSLVHYILFQEKPDGDVYRIK